MNVSLRHWHPRRYSIDCLIKAGMHWVPCKAGNLWQYETFVHDNTGISVAAQYNAKTTLSCVPAMVVARVKPKAINYVMFVNHFATNRKMTVQIHSWLYDEFARICSFHRYSDTPYAYISWANEPSQRLISSLTLSIRGSRQLLAPLQQWYTTATYQSTLFMDFEQCDRPRSKKWLPSYCARPGLHAPHTFMR